MPVDQSREDKRTNKPNRNVFVGCGARRPVRKKSMMHGTMKKILLLISIGLFAMFSAGCITEMQEHTVQKTSP
jgi:hypothetical protein